MRRSERTEKQTAIDEKSIATTVLLWEIKSAESLESSIY